MAKDYYALLGVNRNATDAEIKAAFRRLAHEHHPDKQQGNEAKFKEINEAYQVLGNKEKRSQYDQFGTAFEAGGANPFGGFAWQDMRGGNPFGNGSFQGTQFDFGDLGEMFGDVFGFGSARTASADRSTRGADAELTIPLSFDEAYFGAEKSLELMLDASCEQCLGSGDEPGARISKCTTCDGKGVITQMRTTFLGAVRTQSRCGTCNGTGKRSSKKCTVCHGRTTVQKHQTLNVKIPAGIDPTRTIRLGGRGHAGSRSGLHGDIYIRVTVSPHRLFEREGDDIKSTEEIPLSLLALGGTAEVQTPTGPAKLKVPVNTKSGTRFILRGKGFEHLSGRGRGDQYVTVHARVPERMTPQRKKMLLEFEKGE